MEYTYLELLCYLLIYSFMGWLVEVVVISVRDRKLRNRGFFNLPFCLSYGVTMDLLILVIPSMENILLQYVMQFLASVIISSVVTFLSGGLAKFLSRTTLWDYQENNLFSGKWNRILAAMLQGLVFWLCVLLLHPLVYTVVALIPRIILWIACGVIVGLLLIDFLVIFISLRSKKTPPAMEELLNREQQGKLGLGQRVYNAVWKRLNRAYPELAANQAKEGADGEEPQKPVFARGICFEKMVWVFLILSVFGVLFETVFIFIQKGWIKSRASFIYGPFSIVWGAGAVVLTIVLQPLAKKKGIWVFLFGCLVGGIYEYMASVISEVFFGSTFWDYSDVPLNFGGRTNLWFCLVWGTFSLAWIKYAYPKISKQIEKIPPIPGTVVTWSIAVLLIADMLISGAALLRYVERVDEPEPSNVIEEFIDATYPDSYLDKIWPNIRITE